MSAADLTRVSVLVIINADELDNRLSRMNEAGIDPVIPFVDANGFGCVAYGMAPSGDDWIVGLAEPRDPDSGTPHCCQCQEHAAAECDAGASWTPRYPLTALVVNSLGMTRVAGESL